MIKSNFARLSLTVLLAVTGVQPVHAQNDASVGAQAESSDLAPTEAPTAEKASPSRSVAQASARRSTAASSRTRASSAPRATTTRTRASGEDVNMAKARKLAASGEYQDASRLLFQMSRSPQYEKDSAQIKYILGLMLFEMKLNQSAAFVFYDLVRNESKANPSSKYIRQSLGKLAFAADSLDSDVLLRYAIKQVSEEEFPAASRDMLYYRVGEIKMADKDFAEAARQFGRVRPNSRFYLRARYKQALALVEAGDLQRGQAAFEELAEQTQEKGVTNRMRVSALLGRARTLYQRQAFGDSIEAYREIPRDTEEWHDAIFESSWAMLRDGRFRSALSNFHTLHSPYYEDYYQPESLLLRGIVYLYICRYDDMNAVLDLFDRLYKPADRDVRNFLTSVNEPQLYYRELMKIRDSFDDIRSNKVGRRGFQIPFIVARKILNEGDVKRSLNYLRNLEEERKRIDAMPRVWKTSGIGQYARKIIDKRIEATQAFTGKQVRRHMILVQHELRDLFEQSGFLRFEMISGKKESLRKEISGKGLARVTKVDEGTERDYYIQNGYEYWPFIGEYWRNELGNYHYVGVKACE